MVAADVSPETARVTALGSARAWRARQSRATAQGRCPARRPFRPRSRRRRRPARIDRDRGRIPASQDFVPVAARAFFVQKGSIAVDGVSLTVADLRIGEFDVQIVPFTWEHTRLRACREGDPVNLECDILGKYVARLAAPERPERSHGDHRELVRSA